MAKLPKVVLVTGATGALGQVVCERFRQAGCEVIGLDRRDANLAEAASIRKFLQSTPSKIDTWIHCAGGFRFAKTDEFKDEDLEFLLGSNLQSSFFLARELLPQMKLANFGRIVFVSAKASLQPGAGMGLYSASKAGVNALISALAQEVKTFDINVNAVLPTTIDTPANRKDMPAADFTAWVPREELAEIIFSLTQPWGRSIHGALIPVSGRV